MSDQAPVPAPNGAPTWERVARLVAGPGGALILVGLFMLGAFYLALEIGIPVVRALTIQAETSAAQDVKIVERLDREIATLELLVEEQRRTNRYLARQWGESTRSPIDEFGQFGPGGGP